MIKHEAYPWNEKKRIIEGVASGKIDIYKLIPDHIQKIKCVELTLAGKISLWAYPSESFESILLEFKDKNHNNYARLISKLSQWCTRNNLQPDLKFVSQLKETLGLLESHELYEIPYTQQKPYLHIGNHKFMLLSPEETKQRRQDVLHNPAMIEGVEKLARLIGKKSAEEYFNKFFLNLKYTEIK